MAPPVPKLDTLAEPPGSAGLTARNQEQAPEWKQNTAIALRAECDAQTFHIMMHEPLPLLLSIERAQEWPQPGCAVPVGYRFDVRHDVQILGRPDFEVASLVPERVIVEGRVVHEPLPHRRPGKSLAHDAVGWGVYVRRHLYGEHSSLRDPAKQMREDQGVIVDPLQCCV